MPNSNETPPRHDPEAAPERDLFLLLAEDDANTRLSLELTLKRAGHRVVLANSANGLLEVIAAMSDRERAQIDLLVTDLNMPGMKGEKLIRALDVLGLVRPVLVMTAHGSNEVEKELRRRGHVTILRKPFHPDDLVHAVRETRARYESFLGTQPSPNPKSI